MTDTANDSGQTILDADALLERVDNDMELLEELVDLFLGEHKERIEGLRSALAEGDLQGVNERAHALKGAVSNFAAAPAFEAAVRVNRLANAGTSEGLAEAIDSLDQELARLEPELRKLVGQG